MASPANGCGQRQLVLNWHLTEACNYDCQYCYAKWRTATAAPDLMRDADGTRRMLRQLFEFFRPGNPVNPLGRDMRWDGVRLNLAGGEPLLNQKRTLELIRQAQGIGFDVSLITNASRLDSQTLQALAPALSMIGISLDSGSESTNRGIGRVDRQGRVLSVDSLSDALRVARLANPGLRLKVNTVVNALNCDEDMNAVIRRLAPDKWKVLQMLPVVTSHLEVSAAGFKRFVARHSGLAGILSAEDNDALTGSYIMIDPKGRFFQNSAGGNQTGYHYSRPILQVGAKDAFADLTFDARKFLSRYVKSTSSAPALYAAQA